MKLSNEKPEPQFALSRSVSAATIPLLIQPRIKFAYGLLSLQSFRTQLSFNSLLGSANDSTDYLECGGLTPLWNLLKRCQATALQKRANQMAHSGVYVIESAETVERHNVEVMRDRERNRSNQKRSSK